MKSKNCADINVLVATHKKVNITIPAYCQLIQVGSVWHDKVDGHLHDDFDPNEVGNISNK